MAFEDDAFDAFWDEKGDMVTLMHAYYLKWNLTAQIRERDEDGSEWHRRILAIVIAVKDRIQEIKHAIRDEGDIEAANNMVRLMRADRNAKGWAE